MSFKELEKHAVIGWDFDGTLHRHDKSEEMHRFIKEHPEIRHVIVTFRSHGWQHRVYQELDLDYDDAPTSIHFDGVLNIEDMTYENYMFAERNGVVTPEEEEAVRCYIEWKGEQCKANGITVLVDDDTLRTEQGCAKHGIVLIHPDDL